MEHGYEKTSSLSDLQWVVGKNVVHLNPFLRAQLGTGVIIGVANRARELVKVNWSGQATLSHYFGSLELLASPAKDPKLGGYQVDVTITRKATVFIVAPDIDSAGEHVRDIVEDLGGEDASETAKITAVTPVKRKYAKARMGKVYDDKDHDLALFEL